MFIAEADFSALSLLSLPKVPLIRDLIPVNDFSLLLFADFTSDPPILPFPSLLLRSELSAPSRLFCRSTVSIVVWLICFKSGNVGLCSTVLISSNNFRSLSAFGFPDSGIFDMFSNKIVWRQDKCRPRSDFSLGGPLVDSAGIHSSSANGLEI